MFSAPTSKNARQTENYFILWAEETGYSIWIILYELYRSLQVLTFYETRIKHLELQSLIYKHFTTKAVSSNMHSRLTLSLEGYNLFTRQNHP